MAAGARGWMDGRDKPDHDKPRALSALVRPEPLSARSDTPASCAGRRRATGPSSCAWPAPRISCSRQATCRRPRAGSAPPRSGSMSAYLRARGPCCLRAARRRPKSRSEVAGAAARRPAPPVRETEGSRHSLAPALVAERQAVSWGGPYRYRARKTGPAAPVGMPARTALDVPLGRSGGRPQMGQPARRLCRRRLARPRLLPKRTAASLRRGQARAQCGVLKCGVLTWRHLSHFSCARCEQRTHPMIVPEAGCGSVKRAHNRLIRPVGFCYATGSCIQQRRLP